MELSLKPNIVLTDIRMSVMGGLELSKILKEKIPSTKIVILTGDDDMETNPNEDNGTICLKSIDIR